MPPITSIDQVDVVAGDQACGVGGEQPVGDVDLARRVEAAYGDADQLDRRAHAGGEVAGLLGEQPHHLRARPSRSRARPPSACALRWSRLTDTSPTSVANRSSSVSRRTTTRAAPSRTAITGGRSAWL